MRVALSFILLALACGPQSLNVAKPTATIEADDDAPAEGARVVLRAKVSGGSGGELSYKWEQSSPKPDGKSGPVGTFSSALTAETQWSVPSLCADQSFELRLTVKDGNETVVTTTTLEAVNMDQPFAITGAPTSTQSAITSGDEIILNVSAQAPGCGPTFEWSRLGATSNDFTDMVTNTAIVKWRAPAIASATAFQFQVKVSAPDGTSEVAGPITVNATPATFANVQAIFRDRCRDCHQGAMPAQGLDLSSSDPAVLRMKLSGIATDTVACNTADKQFIVAGDPDNSVLWRRVSGTGGTGCDAMPRGDANYFRARPHALIQFKSWILSGAP